MGQTVRRVGEQLQAACRQHVILLQRQLRRRLLHFFLRVVVGASLRVHSGRGSHSRGPVCMAYRRSWPFLQPDAQGEGLRANCSWVTTASCTIAKPNLQVRAMGGYQLWPRKLWMFALGGLTIAEGVLLACWIVVHCVMMWNWYTNYVKSYDYGKPPLLPQGTSLHSLQTSQSSPRASIIGF